MKTIDDVRRYLADLIHRCEEECGGKVDVTMAGRLAYVANILLGAIKDSDIEVRIRHLEEKLKSS